MDYEREQARLQRLLEEILTSDEENRDGFDDSADEHEEDVVETIEHNSDTEQSVSESDDNNEFPATGPTFIGKDNSTIWMKHKPTQNIRTRAENLIRQLPGPKGHLKTKKSPLEIWNYFFPGEMLEIIVEYTNQHIRSVQPNYAREKDARLTDISEIKAALGLLYLAGVLRSNHLNTADLWKIDGTGVEIFRLTMSENRFKFLLRHLRFDDLETREERKSTDKLAPIRVLFDTFVDRCKNGFTPYHYVTVDEKLEAFRGRCGFRQYIPNKPNKYGLKIFALCDSKLFYTCDLEVYVGKQPPGPYEMSNSPQSITERMCESIKNSGRNVTIDNWFTSLPLIENFKKNFRLTVVGTIRKNKRELPIEFTRPAKRPDKTSMFAYRPNMTLVSYIPKKNRNVILVSSLHHDDKIDPINGKPEIISTYNETKGGVDAVDKLCATYNCARNTRRWPMVIFYAMLNVGAINALVIYKLNSENEKTLRRSFLKELAFSLIEPQLQKRAQNRRIKKSFRNRIDEILGNPSTVESLPTPQENIRGRCAFCDRKKNRPTRYYCKMCNKFLCLEHARFICEECAENGDDTE